jgi:MFS family permease
MSALRPIAALIMAMAVLQLASGMLTVHLPLAMYGDGLREVGVGLVGAAYSAAFMVGAWFGPRVLSRVGHIRAYAASASICAAAILFAIWADHIAAWMLTRAAMGATIALMFAGVESWMSGTMRSQERGGVLGVYMVATKAALALGPFLAPAAVGAQDGAGQGAFIMAGALIALSLTPIALTSQAAPALPDPEPPRFAEMMTAAPAAVVAAFSAGVVNAGVLAMAPLYARSHWGPESATPFVSAAVVGSLLLQWPAAKLSDRMDRRLVIAGLCGIATFAALLLGFVGEGLGLGAAALVFGIWGAGALSYYGLAVAHMADRAPSAALTRCTSGLLFVWAAGAIVGPLLMGAGAEYGGGAGLFMIAALGAFGCAGYMMVRRRIVPAPKRRDAGAAPPPQATSVAATGMAVPSGEELDGPASPNPRPQV